MPKARLVSKLALVLFGLGTAIFLVDMIAPELLAHFGSAAPLLREYCLAVTMFAALLFGVSSAFAINRSAMDMLAGPAPDTKLSVKPLPSKDGKERFQLIMNDGVNEADLLKRCKGWGTTSIVSDQKKTVIVLWIVTILWNLMTIPSIVPVTKAMFERKEWGLAFVYLFPLLGIALFAFTVRQTLQHRRFGKSFLELRHPMAYIGEPFAATIRSSVSFVPGGDYVVRFRCQEQYSTGSGKNRRTVTNILWEKTQRFPSSSHSAFSGIPIELEIPGEASESRDPSTRGLIQWLLSIKAPMEGVDYEAEFEVPVFFRRAAAA